MKALADRADTLDSLRKMLGERTQKLQAEIECTHLEWNRLKSMAGKRDDHAYQILRPLSLEVRAMARWLDRVEMQLTQG